MAKIYNSEVTKGLAQTAAIQQNVDRVPNELADKIVPVLETNPKFFRNSTILGPAFSTATGTITAVGSGVNVTTKRTYVTGIYYSFIKDAACDIATGSMYINLTPIGEAGINIIGIPVITLTAQQDSCYLLFDKPILLQPGTTVTMTGAFTAGAMVRTFSVFGYQIENIKA